MPRKKIDEKIKQDVIKAYENRVPRKTIAERLGISLSSVARIINKKAPKRSQEKGSEPSTKTERQERIEELERRIAELEKRIIEFETKKNNF